MGFETQEQAERWAENMEFRADQRKEEKLLEGESPKGCPKGCTGREQFIIKSNTGNFLGEGDTWNTDRSYAVRFNSREEAETVAKIIRATVTVEPFFVPGYGFGGNLETVG